MLNHPGQLTHIFKQIISRPFHNSNTPNQTNRNTIKIASREEPHNDTSHPTLCYSEATIKKIKSNVPAGKNTEETRAVMKDMSRIHVSQGMVCCLSKCLRL